MKIVIPSENGDVVAKLDMSLYAEERWEQNFPKLAEKETLFAYIARLQLTDTTDIYPYLLTSLKALYCFLDSDEIGSFKEFARLFALTNADLLDKQVKTIQNAFDGVLSGSISNPKN